MLGRSVVLGEQAWVCFLVGMARGAWMQKGFRGLEGV